MENNFKITIPTPCHENWEGMTTTTTGRFCGSCTKNVVDFTAMMPKQIQQYFTDNKGQHICGRFKNEQLETVTIQVPANILYSQMPFHKVFLLALFVAMGTSLFSCKDINGDTQTIGKVEVVDSLKLIHDDSLLGDTTALKLPPPPKETKSTKKGEVDIKKPTKGKVKCVTQEWTTGIIAAVEKSKKTQIDTIKPIIIGKPAPPVIMGEPAVEESKK